MNFNFGIFSALVTKAYINLGDCKYSLGEVLSVFEYYFQEYENAFNETHPGIRAEQIERIIRKMPVIYSAEQRDQGIVVGADCYPPMIDGHFRTRYRDCDYNINHFFSGDIRLMRYCEEIYRDV